MYDSIIIAQDYVVIIMMEEAEAEVVAMQILLLHLI
jgi:hypothetical protein